MLLRDYAKTVGWGFGLRLAHGLEVTPAIVYKWISGEKIPLKRCIQIYSLTHGEVGLEEMRPDIDWQGLAYTTELGKIKQEVETFLLANKA